MRTKLTWLFAVVVALGGLATVVGAGGKKGWEVPVPLSVTIEPIAECDEQSGGTAICPDPEDNGAPYVDGQGMSAQLDIWGALIIDFETRNVLFKSDFLGRAPRLDTYIATRGPIRLQDLGKPGFPSKVCHQMNWVIKDGALNTEYRLLFQRSGYPDPIGPAVEQTAWALVTRTAANEWTVEPRGWDSCDQGTGEDYAAAIVSLPMKGRGDYTYWGTEALPFKLNLTAIAQ